MIKRTILSSLTLWLKAIFKSYYFCSAAAWIKGALALAFQNDYATTGASLVMVAISTAAADLWITDETFGTTKIVIVAVMVTVLFNTIYGIKKSLMMERILFSKATAYEYGTKEYNNFFRRSKRYSFSWRRLQFVLFKSFMLLGYLYFVKNLLEGGDTFLDFSIEILCKAPVAIFWFYEFKSIGENSTFVYGKKASIFKIVEGIFEPRIFKFFGAKTPSDGTPPDIQMDPDDYKLEDDTDITNDKL